MKNLVDKNIQQINKKYISKFSFLEATRYKTIDMINKIIRIKQKIKYPVVDLYKILKKKNKSS